MTARDSSGLPGRTGRLERTAASSTLGRLHLARDRRARRHRVAGAGNEPSRTGLTVETQRLALVRDALLPRLVFGRLRVSPLENLEEAALEAV